MEGSVGDTRLRLGAETGAGRSSTLRSEVWSVRRRLSAAFVVVVLVSALGAPVHGGGPGSSAGKGFLREGKAGAEIGPAAAPIEGFTDSVVFSAIDHPTVVRFAPGGRVFIAEKRGRILIAPSLDLPAEYVLDIRTRVNSFWDRGLLGMVLDPEFEANGNVYVSYTYDHILGDPTPEPRWTDLCPNPPGALTDGCVVSARVSRFTLTGGSFGPEEVLVEDWCMQFPSHSIGDLEFGDDGFLYASGGDGASFIDADWGQFGGSPGSPTPANPCGDPPGGLGVANTEPTGRGGALRSQSLRRPSGEPIALDGTIIRIDPATGAAAPGNPLAGHADPLARRIVAYGFRNPFRFAIRPGTNELWIGDVGWNDTEEINRLANPGSAPVENFGWPCYEGYGQQAGYSVLAQCADLYDDATAAIREPRFAYEHGGAVLVGDGCPTLNSAVTSGVAFYEGGSYPARFDDALFFADHSRNCIWAMRATNGVPDPAKIDVVVREAGNPVDLQAGPNGDIFYVDHEAGQIHRLTFAEGNTAPVAQISATPTSGDAPMEVEFDGRSSADSNPGDTLTYAWDFTDDGTVDATTSTATFEYVAAAVFTARLTVTDQLGASGTTTQQIVADGSGPVIDEPLASLTWAVGDEIDFSGSAVDGGGDPLPASALSWTLTILHCATVTSCHPHVVETRDGVASGTFDAPDHSYPSALEIRLTASIGGVETSDTVVLAPKAVTLGFRTTPNLLDFSINGMTVQGVVGTPRVSRTFIVGSHIGLSTPSPQVLDGIERTFDQWSDGSTSRTRSISAPASPWAPALSALFDPTSADLSLKQRGVVSPNGSSISWKVVARNAEDGLRAHDVRVRVELPRKLARPVFDAPGWSCRFRPALRRVVCDRDSIAAGDLSRIRFTTAIDGDGPKATSEAWVRSSTRDVTKANDRVVTVVILP
jgi:glucose/arabinose dehydrogenase